MRSDDDGPSPQRLYRDTDRRVIAGVAAGVADYFGFGLAATRIVFVIAGLMFMPYALFAYICAALLLKRMPKNLYSSEKEEKFWQDIRRSPKATFSSVRYRMRNLDQSLQRLERYVTSPRFKLDRDFRNLEKQD